MRRILPVLVFLFLIACTPTPEFAESNKTLIEVIFGDHPILLWAYSGVGYILNISISFIFWYSLAREELREDIVSNNTAGAVSFLFLLFIASLFGILIPLVIGVLMWGGMTVFIFFYAVLFVIKKVEGL